MVPNAVTETSGDRKLVTLILWWVWFVVELDGGLGCVEFIVETLLLS